MQITEELEIPSEGAISTIQKENRFNRKLLKANGVLLAACFIILIMHIFSLMVIPANESSVLIISALLYLFLVTKLVAKTGRTSGLLKIFRETNPPAIILNQNGITIPIVFICSNQAALQYFLKKEQKTFFINWDDIRNIELKSHYFKSPDIKITLNIQLFPRPYNHLLIRGDLLADHEKKIIDIIESHIKQDNIDPETQEIKLLEKRKDKLCKYLGWLLLLALIIDIGAQKDDLVLSLIFAIVMVLFIAILSFMSWNYIELYRLFRKHTIDDLNKLEQTDLDKIHSSYKMDIFLAFMTWLMQWSLYTLICFDIIPKDTWILALGVLLIGSTLWAMGLKSYNGTITTTIFQQDDEANSFQPKEVFSRNLTVNVDTIIRRESFINKNDIKILARRNFGSIIILGFWGYFIVNKKFNFGAPIDSLSAIGPSWWPGMIPESLMSISAPIIISIMIIQQLYNNEILIGKNHKRSWKLWQLYNEDRSAVMIFDQTGMSIPIVFLNKDEILDYYLENGQKTLFLPWATIKSLVAVSRERSGLQQYVITLRTPVSSRLGSIIKLRGDIVEEQLFDYINTQFINSHVALALE